MASERQSADNVDAGALTDEPASGSAAGWLRAIAIAAVAIGLAGSIVMVSLPRYLAESTPERALGLDGRQPLALATLADRTLETLVTERQKMAEASSDAAARADFAEAHKDEIENARRQAEAAISRTPLNARGLRMLGQVADLRGDAAAAERLMRGAARLSIREAVANYWLLEASLARDDAAAVITYSDIALRTRSQMTPFIVPVLARLAQSKSGNLLVKKLLASNPPWRRRFMELLPRSVTDARTPLDLMLFLKDTDTPPTLADLRGYLDVLIAAKQYDLAYYTWLQFLPPEQLSSLGLLFNGSFSSATTELPFDWHIPRGSGVSIQIVSRTDRPDDTALRLMFGTGRASFEPISQTIVLAPGTYTFSGSYLGELVAKRGLLWKVACVTDPSSPIGSSRPFNGKTPAWSEFRFALTVPPAGCPMQRLELLLDARSESERLVTGVAWFDDLKIQRNEDDKPL